MKARHFTRRIAAVSALALLAAAMAVTAMARTATVPENIVRPDVSGKDMEGSTLTADKGMWASAPTSFVYKWQRCGTDGSGCSRDVQAGPKSTYTLTHADVGHTIRVVVTGVNADGRSDPAPSDASDVVSSKNGPKNTARPTITGQAKEGEQLTVSPGTWMPTTGVTLMYQWQRCDLPNSSCRNVTGAHSAAYTATSLDVGERLRVLVTAKSTSGSTSVYTYNTAYVQSDQPPPTVNQAPRLTFLSLIRIGRGVYARFRVCDDGFGRITVVERDTKIGALAYTRRYSVYTYASCGVFTRHWTPASRFRTRGRMTVTLQAIDKSLKKSTTRSKSVYRAF